MQYRQEQPQYTFVQPFQQQQNTQNYIGGGGFYGGPIPQQQQYPIPPPPLEIQKEQQQQFNNPFQQQSYQSIQQFSPSISPQQTFEQNFQGGQLHSIQSPNNQLIQIPQVVQNNAPQQTQLPSIFSHQIYNQPMMSIDERPANIIHTVPNVAVPQPNFQKFYNIPQLQPIDGKVGNGWADEKSRLKSIEMNKTWSRYNRQ